MMISIKYGSHLPVLTNILNKTNGPILELGIGIYSTPLLHWLAIQEKRKLTSYDNQEGWIKYFRDSHHEFHEIKLITDWDTLPIDTFWDIAFIDHGPDERRGIDAKRLRNNAKFIILHDTEPENEEKYGYKGVYELFKYRFDYKNAFPNTTVLSNIVDVTNLL